MEFTDTERRAYRSLAMTDLYWFTRWMFANRRSYTWRQAAHHATVCGALMRVFQGECKRLIINIPPRYSKTEIIKNFVAWSLGHAPDSEFIYTSYSARLASASSWDIRDLVQEPEYRAMFPAVILRHDSQAKDEWRTTAGGIMYAVGSGGTITGYGAGKHREAFSGAIIIDDPHKADEAKSDVIRQGVIDWFQITLESRRNSPNTPIILIMQRLHGGGARRAQVGARQMGDGTCPCWWRSSRCRRGETQRGPRPARWCRSRAAARSARRT